jgi:hypothetical protein
MPFWQVFMPEQTMPQVPQLLESVWRSTQAPEHRERPDLHWHCQLTQSSVASHTLSHAPQWLGFSVMSSQPLPQSSVPFGHSQLVPAHTVPPVQTVSQSPQCWSSDRVLKQPSGHMT